MPYQRPCAPSLPKVERQKLLEEYFSFYAGQVSDDASALARKIPRTAFHPLLDEVGTLLQARSAELATAPGPVRDFLEENPLPESLQHLLPVEFRAFCLALNALKQWVVAEQAATDRYLLGGGVKKECRQASTICLATGLPLDAGTVELHHPVRDGRPPIPLSKRGHAHIEGQSATDADDDPLHTKLLVIKRQGNQSWRQLRRGCTDLLGDVVEHSSPGVGASARSFARKASRETGMSFAEILGWLDRHAL